jgi:hypothetical protein
MTDDVLAAIDRRYAVAAVRTEAERAGVDAEKLLDSQKFVDRLTAMNIEEADFPRRVRDLVRSAAPAAPAIPAVPAKKPDAVPPEPREPAQWTREDLARNRNNPKVIQDAMAAGLLSDLGVAPRRRRR